MSDEQKADEKKALASPTLVGLLILAGLAWFWFGGGLEQQTANTMADIHNKVAADAVAQYGMTKRSGTPVEVCVHAGLVAAAYLQAQDESNYKKWKATEATDCATAGMPK